MEIIGKNEICLLLYWDFMLWRESTFCCLRRDKCSTNSIPPNKWTKVVIDTTVMKVMKRCTVITDIFQEMRQVPFSFPNRTHTQMHHIHPERERKREMSSTNEEQIISIHFEWVERTILFSLYLYTMVRYNRCALQWIEEIGRRTKTTTSQRGHHETAPLRVEAKQLVTKSWEWIQRDVQFLLPNYPTSHQTKPKNNNI